MNEQCEVRYLDTKQDSAQKTVVAVPNGDLLLSTSEVSDHKSVTGKNVQQVNVSEVKLVSPTAKATLAEENRKKVLAYWTSSGFELTRLEKAQKYSSKFDKERENKYKLRSDKEKGNKGKSFLTTLFGPRNQR
jgi:uncharacterized Rmd1/YagE family protein